MGITNVLYGKKNTFLCLMGMFSLTVDGQENLRPLKEVIYSISDAKKHIGFGVKLVLFLLFKGFL